MADSERKLSNHVSSGFIDGTGSLMNVFCGFKPKSVFIMNVDGLIRAHWDDLMDNDSMIKIVDASVAGTIAVTPHADSGGAISVTPHADSAGVVDVTPHADSAGTPAEATPATVANAVSDISAAFLPDYNPIVKPTIALTHNADPETNLDALPLFVTEALAGASENCGILQSINNTAGDVLGETADGSVFGAAGSARFWVAYSAAPTGVQIYVNESAADQLECVSPSEEDVVVLMPMENAAGVGSAYVKVLIHHNVDAATGKALSFDDNGAADAQLIYVDTGAAGSNVPPSDVVEALSGVGVGAAGGFGEAEAQVAVVTPGSYDALANHSHASTAAMNTTHSHASTAALDSTHSHANTAVFTGTGGGMSVVSADGIIPMFNGFKIGVDADLNVVGEDLYWVAIK